MSTVVPHHEEQPMLTDRYKSDTRFTSRCAIALALAGVWVAAQGCSSDDSTATPQTDGGGSMEGGACPSGGGPLAGTAMDHCMRMFQEVGMCMKEPEDAGGAATDGG